MYIVYTIFLSLWGIPGIPPVSGKNDAIDPMPT